MKRELSVLSGRSHAALRKHLKRGGSAGLRAASGVGRRAMTLGLGTLDVTGIHEQALIKLVQPGDSPTTRAATVRRARSLFAQAITPIEKTHRTAHETNGRLGQASRAEVEIQKLDGAICMRIGDNGKGFQEEHVLQAKKGKRLGLLGMRERLEMVGGNFTVTSAPGKGTTVLAQIPLVDRTSGGGEEPR